VLFGDCVFIIIIYDRDMEIKRTIDTKTATYDITGLTGTEFRHLFQAYEKQWYVYCNRYPDDSADPLLAKLRKMIEAETIIV